MLYQVYCVLTFLMHMAVVYWLWWIYQNSGSLLAPGSPFSPSVTPEDQALADLVELSKDLLRKAGVVFIGSSLFFGVGSLAILRFRDTKEAWITHLINLGLGALTCVLLPLAVPVGLMMLKADFKEWFIRAPAAPPAP